jgi:hypothetical protein
MLPAAVSRRPRPLRITRHYAIAGSSVRRWARRPLADSARVGGGGDGAGTVDLQQDRSRSGCTFSICTSCMTPLLTAVASAGRSRPRVAPRRRRPAASSRPAAGRPHGCDARSRVAIVRTGLLWCSRSSRSGAGLASPSPLLGGGILLSAVRLPFLQHDAEEERRSGVASVIRPPIRRPRSGQPPCPPADAEVEAALSCSRARWRDFCTRRRSRPWRAALLQQDAEVERRSGASPGHPAHRAAARPAAPRGLRPPARSRGWRRPCHPRARWRDGTRRRPRHGAALLQQDAEVERPPASPRSSARR